MYDVMVLIYECTEYELEAIKNPEKKLDQGGLYIQ